MTQARVSPQAYTLFLDLFQRAVAQLLAEPGTISDEAILERVRTLLPDHTWVIRSAPVPEADLQRLGEVIGEVLAQQARHMQHYRYGWKDLRAHPALFQSFVREVLQ